MSSAKQRYFSQASNVLQHNGKIEDFLFAAVEMKTKRIAIRIIEIIWYESKYIFVEAAGHNKQILPLYAYRCLGHRSFVSLKSYFTANRIYIKFQGNHNVSHVCI